MIEEQVDSVGVMDQVADPANISLHAIQTFHLAEQVILHEVGPEPPVEFLVTCSPVDES